MSQKPKPLEQQTDKQLGTKRHNVYLAKVAEDYKVSRFQIFLQVARSSGLKLSKSTLAKARGLRDEAKEMSGHAAGLELRISRIQRQRAKEASHTCPGCGHYHERKTGEGSH